MGKIFQILCVVVILSFTSCASRKSLIYLHDMEEQKEYPVIQKYEAVIQRDDKLSIKVNCKNPELALAFNIPGEGGGYSIGSDGAVTTTATTSSNDANSGYLVDTEGNIDFPILGKLHVEGLSRGQLSDMIKRELIDKQLLKDPIVMVNFLNFKISILGEVGHVGTFPISGDRITLLDAIAMAGDLNNNARIDNVAVIREYGNTRRIIRNDLRSKNLFLSPAYYLQQNDIVYVEPNGNRVQEQSQRRFNYWSMGLSTATTITTLVLYFTNMKK